MNRTRQFVVAIIAVVVLIGGGIWLLTLNHRTPRQQSPLADLKAQSIPMLQAKFNQETGMSRIILLLSPT